MPNTNTAAFRSLAGPGLLSLVVPLLMLVTGCTSFHGIGDYSSDRIHNRTPGDKTAKPTTTPLKLPAEKNALPSLVWSGEKHLSVPRTPAFEWPVEQIRMSRGFLYGAKAHWGLDLANQRGTPILAAEAGTVIYTGAGFRGYGKLIVVEHNDEWATLYAHLDKINVKEGQLVAKGQRLGGMGRTGRSSGVHLHFEIRYRRQPVNPLAYLPDTPKFASLSRSHQ